MIISRLTGGLGNQMFQYALGRRLAYDRGTALALDIGAFRGAAMRGETPRSYRLNFLRIQAEILPAWRAAVVLPFPRRLPRRLAKLPHWPGLVTQITEQGDAFDAQVLQAPANAYLDGYWQSEKYFVACADLIRADFALREPLSPARQEVADQMTAGVAVSLHVRRGDYVTNASANAFHGTCSPAWYAQAIQKMAADLAAPRFFIFSDDPAWARANLPGYPDSVFVDPQPDGREFEDLHLMARCRHHIIANSSFSWWGAWLNPDPAKKVIAPLRWFAAGGDTADRTPVSWTRL